VQRTIQAGGAQLCTEAFGDAGDPPVLLIMGMGASMVWWDEGFCERLADGRRYVIRYDHRDTGLSTTYNPGSPGYGSAELVADAGAILDGYGIDAAHVVGLSMGGALAQVVALDEPHRVRSLVLITTGPAVPVARSLPGSSAEYRRFLADARVDWTDAHSAIEYLVDHWRVLSGDERPFDADHIRRLAAADVRRAHNIACAQNHAGLDGDGRRRGPLAAIKVPTLVIMGPPIPCLRPRTATPWPRRSPGRACSPSRGPVTASRRPTGTLSCRRSSSTPGPPRSTAAPPRRPG
jgi:pimeloyl-ACP methyl ester carboxylesterase